MTRLYPAFQLMFSVNEAGSGRMWIDVYGTEVLARNGMQSDSFDRPEGTSWRSVDLKMANVLQQNVDALPCVDKKVFINVSQYSLNDDESFFRWLAAAARLRHTLGSERRVVVEVTEHVENDTLHERWCAMQECGLLLAMDDLGLANSTFDRLKMFPWDFCKFDLSVLTEEEIERGADYCWKAKITGIAEKVETRAQSFKGLRNGLSIQQGYLFCRPITKQLTIKESLECAQVS